MENKYFTPSIEDIRVGYELHSQWFKETIEHLMYAEYYKNQIDAGSSIFLIIQYEKINNIIIYIYFLFYKRADECHIYVRYPSFTCTYYI